MATTAYAIRHKASGRYIAAPPSSNALHETRSVTKAETWDFMTEAEIERLYLGTFANTYEVVPVALPEMRTSPERAS